MTDVNTSARNYIDLWNERAQGRRREMLAANWTTDAKYVDPLMSGDGHDGVDALVAGVQQRFPVLRRDPVLEIDLQLDLHPAHCVLLAAGRPVAALHRVLRNHGRAVGSDHAQLHQGGGPVGRRGSRGSLGHAPGPFGAFISAGRPVPGPCGGEPG